MEDEEETINDEILIALVRENPVLYDKKHRDYKNQEVKKDAWNMILETCGILSSGILMFMDVLKSTVCNLCILTFLLYIQLKNWRVDGTSCEINLEKS